MASRPSRVLPKKLRLTVVRSGDARPIPGVALEAVAEVEAPDASPTHEGGPEALEHVGFGILRSDHVGFVSFDLRSLERADGEKEAPVVRHLWVMPVGDEARRVDVLEHAMATGERAFALVLDGVYPATRLGDIPAVQSPDVRDWEASPRSFGTSTLQIVGQDGCEELLPSQAAVRSFNFTQIVRAPATEIGTLAPAPSGPCDPAPAAAPLCFREGGAILEYLMEWVPMGHGLGEVLYSLPLAPCETVRLAIIDWSRTDTTARSEDLSLAEQLAHNQRRDRAVDEIVEGAVSEWQRGGTVMGALAGSYSSGSFSLAASAGAAYATSAGDRNVTGRALQTLDDGIAQSTTNVRRLTSTVVVQASQGEQERLQTRAVTNHNHCHALTVLYYEVVRHFAIRTWVRTVREILLVKHPDQSFDLRRLVRDADRLRPLLPEALRGALDAAGRLLSSGVTTGVVVGPAQPPGAPITRLLLDLYTSDSGQNPGSQPQHWVTFQLLLADGSVRSFRVRDPENPAIDHRLGAASRDDDRTFLPNTIASFAFDFNPAINRAAIKRIGVHWRRDPGDLGAWWLLGSVDCRYAGPAIDLKPLVQREVSHRFGEDSDLWIDVPPEPVNVAPALSADELMVRSVLSWLEARRAEVNRVLWLTEPPDRRAMWLEKYLFQRGDVQGRLADFVENRVVDTAGEYVALALGEASPSLLEDLHIDVTATTERIVSVPTRGAFAEAKLSHCNACEEVDATRFWDWQQSPCSCDAPEIAPIGSTSRSAPLSASPTGLPGPSTSVQSPAAAPDPAGLGRVFELLGKSEIFRDMSAKTELASVLGKLIDGAVAMEVEQIKRGNTDPHGNNKSTGHQNKALVEEPGTTTPATSPGTGTPSGGQAPAQAPALSAGSPADVDAGYRNAQRAVERAAASGAITAQQKADLTRALVEAQVAKVGGATAGSTALPNVKLVGAGGSALTTARFVLWTDAVDPQAQGNAPALRPDFLNYDPRSFAIQVHDAGAAGAGTLTVEWDVEHGGLPYTLFHGGAPLDLAITCYELAGQPGTFRSAQLGLVADEEDYIPTRDLKTMQEVLPGKRDHKLRLAPLTGTVVARYTNAAGKEAKASADVFARSPEERRRLKVYLYAVRGEPTPAHQQPVAHGAVALADIITRCAFASGIFRRFGIEIESADDASLQPEALAKSVPVPWGSLNVIDPHKPLTNPVDDETLGRLDALRSDPDTLRVYFVPTLAAGPFLIHDAAGGCIFVTPSGPYDFARAIAILLASKQPTGTGRFAWRGNPKNPEQLHLTSSLPSSPAPGAMTSKRVWEEVDGEGFDWLDAIRKARWVRPW